MTRKLLSDAQGLVVSTDSIESLTAYLRGVDLLLKSSADAVAALHEALEADPEFDLARVALACAHAAKDEQADAPLGKPSCCGCPRTRRERQHIEVITLVLGGDNARASVLGREHLREFPDDVLVVHMLTRGRLG